LTAAAAHKWMWLGGGSGPLQKKKGEKEVVTTPQETVVTGPTEVVIFKRT
jgi:hypothetical protein